MIYDYNQATVFLNSLEVKDFGNTAIRATTEEGLELYLIIASSQGSTLMIEFGPVLPDLPVLPKGYKLTVSTISFKEAKIDKAINDLINDSKYPAVKAEVIDVDDALCALPQIKDVLEFHMSEVH